MKAIHRDLAVTLTRYEAQMTASVTADRVLRYRQFIDRFDRLPSILKRLLGGRFIRLLLELAYYDAEDNYLRDVMDDFMDPRYGAPS